MSQTRVSLQKVVRSKAIRRRTERELNCWERKCCTEITNGAPSQPGGSAAAGSLPHPASHCSGSSRVVGRVDGDNSMVSACFLKWKLTLGSQSTQPPSCAVARYYSSYSRRIQSHREILHDAILYTIKALTSTTSWISRCSLRLARGKRGEPKQKYLEHWNQPLHGHLQASVGE